MMCWFKGDPMTPMDTDMYRKSISTGTVPVSTYLALVDQYRTLENEHKRVKHLLDEFTKVVQEVVDKGESK